MTITGVVIGSEILAAAFRRTPGWSLLGAPSGEQGMLWSSYRGGGRAAGKYCACVRDDGQGQCSVAQAKGQGRVMMIGLPLWHLKVYSSSGALVIVHQARPT